MSKVKRVAHAQYRAKWTHVIEKDQNIVRRLSIKQEFKQRQSKNITEHK